MHRRRHSLTMLRCGVVLALAVPAAVTAGNTPAHALCSTAGTTVTNLGWRATTPKTMKAIAGIIGINKTAPASSFTYTEPGRHTTTYAVTTRSTTPSDVVSSDVIFSAVASSIPVHVMKRFSTENATYGPVTVPAHQETNLAFGHLEAIVNGHLRLRDDFCRTVADTDFTLRAPTGSYAFFIRTGSSYFSVTYGLPVGP